MCGLQGRVGGLRWGRAIGHLTSGSHHNNNNNTESTTAITYTYIVYDIIDILILAHIFLMIVRATSTSCTYG